MHPAKLIATILSLISPLTFSIATSPTVVWHQYNVIGKVVRDSGPKTDFAIVIAGKIGNGSYQRLRGVSIGRAQYPVGITDSLGAFFISVSESMRCDSLVVMALIPDREPVAGVPFLVSSASTSTEYGTYTDPDLDPSCSGCSTTPKTRSVVTGYVYSCPDQTLTIPF